MRQRPPMAATAEIALLVACAEAAIGTGGARAVANAIGPDVRWSVLLEQAEWHNLLPITYRALQHCCAGEVPSEVLTALRERSLAVAARNLFLTRELGTLLAVLASRNIDVLALKGPLLAQQAYGDLASRAFADLDLLVHERDLAAVRSLLAARGFQPAQVLNPAVEGAAGKGLGQIDFLGDGVTVDLHWRLAPPIFPLGPDLDRAWQRTAVVMAGGVEVPTLSLTDTLLFLCCHGAKHYWDTLEWIVAVAALVRRGGVDLAAVLAEARSLHCERAVLLALALAHRLLHVPLPTAILARADADRAVRILLERLCRPLLAGERVRSSVLHEAGLSLLIYDRNRDRARHCLQLIARPQDTDLIAMPLPAPLHALYSAFRPLRLAAKYARSGVRRLRGM